jgi:hypothetical protein
MTKLHSFILTFSLPILGQTACDSTSQTEQREKPQAEVPAQDDGAGGSHAGPHAGSSATSAGGAAQGGARSTPSGGQGGAPTSSRADADAGAGTETDEGAAAGTFTHVYEKAFRTCRLQCHLMGFSMLDMSSRDAAYASLVDHDSNPKNEACAKLGLKRVKPGEPDKSLLYLKLDTHAPCGQQMPPGGQLPQELRDEVREWIARGAKDN